MLGAPFFPYDGAALLIETEGDKSIVEQFVKDDPYVKNKIVAKYEIKEFDGATVQSRKQFDRLASEFMFRS